MKITQAEIDRYRAALSRRQVEAAAYVRARLAADGSAPGEPGYRARAVEIMQDCMGVYGDQAQALSATLFDEVCEAEGISARAVMFDDVIDGTAMAEKIGYYAGADGNDRERYIGHNADLAALYVHKSALENMVRNCRRGEVRFARVATGRESCGWCFMLSSRGFVYSTDRAAEAGSHHHCDCVIVPGKRGRTRIAGYDPDEMGRRWAQCSGTVGPRDGYRRSWDAMSAEEKAGFAPKGKGARGSKKPTFEAYYDRQVMRECETRDREWLYRGAVPRLEYSDDSVLKKKTATRTARSNHELEKRSAEKLREIGFGTKFVDDEVKIAGGGSVGYADLDNGIEIKTVYSASSPNTISKHVSSCKGKKNLKRIVVDVSENEELDDETACEYVSNAIWRHGFGEAHVLKHDGSLVRVTPKKPERKR